MVPAYAAPRSVRSGASRTSPRSNGGLCTEQMVVDEEGHFDLFDKQLDNIERFGPSYLALQSFGSAPEQPGPAAE